MNQILRTVYLELSAGSVGWVPGISFRVQLSAIVADSGLPPLTWESDGKLADGCEWAVETGPGGEFRLWVDSASGPNALYYLWLGVRGGSRRTGIRRCQAWEVTQARRFDARVVRPCGTGDRFAAGHLYGKLIRRSRKERREAEADRREIAAVAALQSRLSDKTAIDRIAVGLASKYGVALDTPDELANFQRFNAEVWAWLFSRALRIVARSEESQAEKFARLAKIDKGMEKPSRKQPVRREGPSRLWYDAITGNRIVWASDIHDPPAKPE